MPPGFGMGMGMPGMPGGMPPQRMVRGTYLGIGVAELNPILSHQLRLPLGFGLAVTGVKPGSPADGALAQHDILLRLDEQILINSPQLTVLVRSRQPQETVEFSVLREGTETKVEVTLTEHEVTPLEDLLQPQPRPAMPQFQPGWNPMMLQPPGPGAIPHQRVERHDDGTVTATVERNGLTATLKANANGDRWFTIRDSEKRIVFEGPVRTDREREELTPDLRPLLKHAEALVKAGGAGNR
jgi:hypothetical protein